MKDRKSVVIGLLILAMAIWGWNFYRIAETTPEPFEMDSLPEIPLEASAKSRELPQLRRDPFQRKREEKVDKPKRQAPTKQRRARATPPRGKLVLLLERDGEVKGLYGEGNKEPFEIEPGAKIGEWAVVKITLEQVELEHANGQKYILTLQ